MQFNLFSDKCKTFQGNPFVFSTHTKLLANKCTSHLFDIDYHDLWMASMLLDPVYRSLWFANNEHMRFGNHEEWMDLIRQLMEKLRDSFSNNDVIHDTALEINDDLSAEMEVLRQIFRL